MTQCYLFNVDAFWEENNAEQASIDGYSAQIMGAKLFPQEDDGADITIEITVQRDHRCYYMRVRNRLNSHAHSRTLSKFVQIGLAGGPGTAFREAVLQFSHTGPGPLFNTSLLGGPITAQFLAVGYTRLEPAPNQQALLDTAQSLRFGRLFGPVFPPNPHGVHTDREYEQSYLGLVAISRGLKKLNVLITTNLGNAEIRRVVSFLEANGGHNTAEEIQLTQDSPIGSQWPTEWPTQEAENPRAEQIDTRMYLFERQTRRGDPFAVWLVATRADSAEVGELQLYYVYIKFT